MVTFVLVHSPLVGPLTWALVVDELRKRHVGAIAPALPDSRKVDPPYWKAHADAVARDARLLPPEERIILAGHSGAGVLLPAIREAIGRPVAGYLFVDAGLPSDGKSRLDLFEANE